MPRVRFVAFLAAMLPSVALATNVSGPLPSDTTWTPAGNPYHLTGDLTVPAGMTLTLQPGVVVTFANTDGLGTGTNTSEAELIVNGTLLSQGTSASPVSITATNAYGVRVLAGGAATLDFTTMMGGLFTLTNNGTTTANNVTVQGGTTECVRVSGGTFDFTSGTLTNCPIALKAVGGTTNLSYSLVKASGSTGSTYEAIQLVAPANLLHNTFTSNNYGAVGVYNFTGNVSIIDNIIASNGSYGLSFANTTTPTRDVHHNLVWSNTTGYSNVSSGSGGVSANPLFVGGTNYRITENSPARFAASDGTDMGAFPYTGDATSPLQGVLYSDKTLTGANSIAGDLTVRAGVTLTLAAGASLTFSAIDRMDSGIDTAETELIVNGTLLSQGTSASPVSITATNAYGVRVLSGATATLDYTTLTGGPFTLSSSGTTSLSNSTVQGGTTECVRVSGGTFDFTSGTLTNCPIALKAVGGTTNLSYSLVKASGSTGSTYEAIQLVAPANLLHNTFTSNNYGAVGVYNFTGNVSIIDNIIASNGSYGLSFANTTTPTRDVHHNLVWSNTTGYSNVSSGSGGVSANPLFVGGTNYRITENSPARFAASDGTDMGAFPYTGDATSPLQGVLYSDKTLTGANSIAGDLTVRAGVTLTLAAGASLTFSAIDRMDSGIDTAETELIVNGTLLSQGTSASPVSITATNAYGVRVLSGATATLDYTTLTGGPFTLSSSGTTSLSNSTVQGGTTECVRVSGGTFDFTSGTLTNCPIALKAVGGTTNLSYSLVKASGFTSSAYEAIQLVAPANLLHNTFTSNNYGAVGVYNFTGNVSIIDNIIASNGSYGLSFANTTTPTRDVHHNLVWSNTTGYSNVSSGSGGVSANPLFVGGTNYRITENSPARFAASDGTDMGAFPYTGDATSPLQGVLYSDKTLTGANSIAGDLTVRAGVTLTLAAGASLTFSAIDRMDSGIDTAETELIVNGTLLSQGTSASPVSITATNAYGVRVLSGATATLDYTTLTGGPFTLSSSGTTSLSNSTVQGGTTECVRVSGGTFDFTSGTLTNCPIALNAVGGTTNLSYSLVKASGFTSTANEAIQLSAPANLIHNTFTSNNYGAVGVRTFSTGAVNILDNIITSNGTYGLNFSSPSSPARSVHHNDVWTHTTNYNNVSGGTGALSVNPLFVSSTNYTLQETSPCRNVASDGTDMGAFPYVPPVPSRVVVSPASASLTVQGSQQFTATAYDAANNPIPNRPITWSASGAAGTINATGLFTAGCAPGTFTGAVTATIDGRSGTADVTLVAGSVATVTLSPPSATLAVNETVQFTMTSKDACGNTLTSPASWSVTAGGGSINSSGLFTAGTTTGTFTNTVQALSGAMSATATVTVTVGALASIDITPNPKTLTVNASQQFTAVGKDALGNVVPVTPTWSVVNGGGTIDAGGIFTAGTVPGTYANTVQATSNGVSGQATVTVQPGALASIEVTPNPVTLGINGVQQFTATGKDAVGNTVSLTPTWSVVNGGGTLDASGRFTAGTTPGTYANTVKVSSGSVSATVTVTVNPGALASIEVAPSTRTLSIHGTQAFTATGKDSAGNTVPVSVTWSVVNGGGTIAADGLFTAGTVPGTYTSTVKATQDGFSGFATVIVQPGELASIEVTPNPVTLGIQGVQKFTATGKDSAGNIVPASVTWSVANGGGTIAADGTFTAGTALGTYTDTVKATQNGISGFASVTVQAGGLASIVVTPDEKVLTIGASQKFTASGRDSAGNTVPVTVTWSVVNGGGTVAADGTFTAGTTPGTYANTVKATQDGISGFASVTVEAGALATLELTPDTATLPIHGVQTFSATGKDSAGNVIPVSVTWSVEQGGGTIDAGGTFTAGTVPGTFTHTVKARQGGVSAFATVTVNAGALVSLELTPDAAILPVKGTRRFTVTGKDSAGNTVPAPVTWSVEAGGGTIDDSGLFTAGTVAGTYMKTVQAKAGSLSVTADITVEPGAVHAVAVAPAAATLGVHGTKRFTATATDAFGNTVPGTPVWSVQPETVGTLDADGTFTAGGTAGDYAAAVTATLAGVRGSADVSLLPGALAKVLVTPASLNLEARGTRQFSARGEDADGNTVAITPVWSVIGGAGTLTSEGLFTATQHPGSYPDSVQASAEGITGTASITVAPGGIHHVVLSPREPTVAVHGTVAFSAKAFDAFDNEIGLLTPTWEVINGGGTIDASGVFTAGADSGTFSDTVKVTMGGKSDTTSVTVATDFDGDGMPDAWELANGFDPSTADDASLDADGDALTNAAEFELGTKPRDADTDDDGVLDGQEPKPGEDADGDGLANVKDPDSDNDGLTDGTEMAVTTAHADTDVSQGHFTADADPASSTGPLTPDTDGDGRKDGDEDANHNGKVDSGETDPNVAETFCKADPECGSGQVCGGKGVCVAGPGEEPHIPAEGGCGCSGAGTGSSVFGLALLALLGRVGVRRRRA
ncbi:MYXO-CTERM sorting domain-containing protein [Myxococcaceae bacterium GXIMD 01537]